MKNNLIFLIPAIEVFSILLPAVYISTVVSCLHIQMAVICLITYNTKPLNLFLVSAYFLWLFITGFLPYYSQSIALIEVAILSSLLFWVNQRPERIPSDPPSSNTVQIAFYYGVKAPLVAKIISIFNLPFYSIAIVIGDDVMMPSGREKCVKKVSRRHLNSWTILDTKIPVDNDLLTAFKALEGASIGKADCMKVIGKFLNKLGDDYKPGSDPSSYMSKILGLRV